MEKGRHATARHLQNEYKTARWCRCGDVVGVGRAPFCKQAKAHSQEGAQDDSPYHIFRGTIPIDLLLISKLYSSLLSLPSPLPSSPRLSSPPRFLGAAHPVHLLQLFQPTGHLLVLHQQRPPVDLRRVSRQHQLGLNTNTNTNIHIKSASRQRSHKPRHQYISVELAVHQLGLNTSCSSRQLQQRRYHKTRLKLTSI